MNRVFYINIILLIGWCLIVSCKKTSWYDAKPYQQITVPSSLKDLQAILDYSLTMNRYSPSLGEVASDGHYISNESYLQLDAMEKNAYTWSYKVPYKNIIEWNYINIYGAYPRVYSCNLVLESLDKVSTNSSLDLNVKRNIKGQALFHRARTFFELSQIFAPQYNYSTSHVDLGIPIRTNTDLNVPSTRQTVEETYGNIIEDLKASGNLLIAENFPVSNLYKVRPTKAAVFGLLARVYLSMENYEQALLYSDSCLKIHNSLLDYSLVENTFQPFPILNAEVIWHASVSDQFTSLQSYQLLIDPELYNQYSTDDLRKELFFTKDEFSNSINFKGNYSGTGELFCGLATDEIILIRAECNIRVGDLEGGVKDLNNLLRTRWRKVNGITTYVDRNITSRDEALELILIERKKELLLRGIRWSDLRRLNRDDRFRIQLRRNTPEGEFKLDANSYQYTFPIPDDVIQLSGMKQNPGWKL